LSVGETGKTVIIKLEGKTAFLNFLKHKNFFRKCFCKIIYISYTSGEKVSNGKVYSGVDFFKNLHKTYTSD